MGASLNEDLDVAKRAFRHVMETADEDLSSLAARNLGIVLDHKNNTDEARAA
ncbi:hypothetical protein [Streptomyces sp. NPDC001642]|uniref:hypothetical protein n=1 Tax=Streptomyces sp. NPDC001642 TaxID=3154392 RepID=UPI003316BE37